MFGADSDPVGLNGMDEPLLIASNGVQGYFKICIWEHVGGAG